MIYLSTGNSLVIPLASRRSYFIEAISLIEIEALLSKAGIVYHKMGHKLEVTATHFTSVVKLLEDYELEYTAKDKETKTRINKIQRPVLLPPKEEVIYPQFKVPLFSDQKQAILFGMKKKRFLIADLPGTGKTISAIAQSEYVRAHYKFKHTLVICCIASNQLGWKKEVEAVTDSGAYILGTREVTRGSNKGRFKIKGGPEKLVDLNSDIKEFFLITNIQALRNDDIAKRIQELIQDGTIGHVVVDEIHEGVNRGTRQGDALANIQTSYRVALSGTPFNSPENAYAVAKWLGATYATKQDYLSRYGISELNPHLARATGRAVFDYKFTEVAKFRYELQDYMIRRHGNLKDLPTIMFKDILVEMGKEQQKLYDEIVEKDSLNISGIKSILDLGAQEDEANKSIYLRARQALSAPGVYGVEEDAKLEALIPILRNIEANGKKAIVFTFFRETTSKYERVLGKEFPKRGLYATDSVDAGEVVQEFRNGDYTFIVGGVKKIGTGHNIQNADYVIFVDRPETWNIYEQNYKRAWRQGRTEPVVVYKILIPDSWDDQITYSLQEKKSLSDSIFGNSMQVENVV